MAMLWHGSGNTTSYLMFDYDNITFSPYVLNKEGVIKTISRIELKIYGVLSQKKLINQEYIQIPSSSSNIVLRHDYAKAIFEEFSESVQIIPAVISTNASLLGGYSILRPIHVASWLDYERSIVEWIDEYEFYIEYDKIRFVREEKINHDISREFHKPFVVVKDAAHQKLLSLGIPKSEFTAPEDM